MSLLSESEIREIAHNTVIRGRAKGWSNAKIKRRIMWKARLAKVWAVGKKIPFRPFGGAIIGAGELIKGIVRGAINDDDN